MPQRFGGSHGITLDEKSRVVIPARWRELLGGKVTVQLSEKGCLAIYPQATWDARYEMLNARAQTDMRSARELDMLLQYTEEELDVDRSGRLLIPHNMRDFYSFEGDLLLTGANDKLELWRKAEHEAYYRSERDYIIQSRDNL